MPRRAQLTAILRSLHWTRGLRAGVAVSVAMFVCHLLGRPMGWAALGGFEAILVDNGGPYRSRLATMATLMAGGAAGCMIAAMTTTPLALACAAAAAFCFAVTFARVIAQPIASTSVIILVIYFAGIGGAEHTWAAAATAALAFVLGGAWAAALSLVLWPLDPFRPARRAVAACYTQLAAFTAILHATGPHSPAREAARLRTHAFQRSLRLQLETARSTLGATTARATARTVRARNLTVLLETADLLFAETLRWTELIERVTERATDLTSEQALAAAARWLSHAAAAIATGLDHRPADGAASFAPEGSHSLQHLRRRVPQPEANQPLLTHIADEEREARQNLEIAFEAVRAVWSGTETRATRLLPTTPSNQPAARLFDALRANWTPRSVMMRHALRVAIVAAVDVLLMRVIHVSHGSWLAMTSIIVLQPYAGTLRKGLQRVGGTIAGGILAALLAATIHSQAGIILVITLTSIMTLATYAVDYGWYSFFLTPTFVLMSLPHLRDWRFAGVRIATTVLGAAVAVLAMRLLWPEREDARLGRLLGRAAAAAAGYLRATLQYWEAGTSADARQQAERALLAPARRAAGLAILAAEDTLDRLLLEPSLPLRRPAASDARADALTCITYLRRLARAATTLAAVGSPAEAPRISTLAHRLDALGATLLGTGPITPPTAAALNLPEPTTVAEQQLQRIERQVTILERAATTLQTRPSTQLSS